MAWVIHQYAVAVVCLKRVFSLKIGLLRPFLGSHSYDNVLILFVWNEKQ